ncbi:MAG: VWA domain-containing protein [Chloroflexi bacterium]|nr:MAG: VWA domain-containing protein [Chloroflexota bacterium]
MTRANRDGRVKLTIRPSRRAVARHSGGVHLLVRAEPPRPPARKERRPVALALVLDRSGSMGQAAAGGPAGPAPLPVLGQPGRGVVDTGRADKLSYVKAATLRLLDLMQDGDAVALVTFDDQVAVTKPLTVLDDRSRRALAGAVGRIAAGGSTFLEGGLRAGLEQFGEATLAHYGCKLVLLSDGRANVGEQRPAVLAEVAAAAAHRGITTSTLGVGFDYHIALMSSLAEAGNGDFSHIGSLESLDEILREEFTAAAEVTARGVSVDVELPERLASRVPGPARRPGQAQGVPVRGHHAGAAGGRRADDRRAGQVPRRRGRGARERGRPAPAPVRCRRGRAGAGGRRGDGQAAGPAAGAGRDGRDAGARGGKPGAGPRRGGREPPHAGGGAPLLRRLGHRPPRAGGVGGAAVRPERGDDARPDVAVADEGDVCRRLRPQPVPASPDHVNSLPPAGPLPHRGRWPVRAA